MRGGRLALESTGAPSMVARVLKASWDLARPQAGHKRATKSCVPGAGQSAAAFAAAAAVGKAGPAWV